MEFFHKPVLYEQSIDGLDIQPDGTYIDGTVGGGGHSAGIVGKLSQGGTLLCLDQDEKALQEARGVVGQANVHGATVCFEKSNFANMKEVLNRLGVERVDGILLDIGVSSYQLDDPLRGFSYNQDADLDMRMDKDNPLTAYKIINTWKQEELKDIMKRYGEERWAHRIAQFIEEERKKKPIQTTLELVEIIKKAVPRGARQEMQHPAKRVFQAIRIAVNNELGVLETVLKTGTTLLRAGGRFCIISFHSLEDRIVKQGFLEFADPCRCPKQFPICTCGKKPSVQVITKKPIVATEEEKNENPRARSAKLRIAKKI
jgi:16S rRNA (cytosine1402-N4)-methyltransferase